MMDLSGITLLGLGPGDASLLTRQAWQVLESIPEIYLRTRHHPAVDGFPASLKVNSFDYLYQQGGSFDVVYQQIVEQVLEMGRLAQGVVYAVPGHPYVAEATCPKIISLARQEGLPVRVFDGLSFLEPVFSTLGKDPLPLTALVDALELAAAHIPSFPPDAPALIAQIYSKAVASEVKLTLMEVYPDEHTVQMVHAVGTPQSLIETLPLYEIDRSSHIGMQTALYVPPLGSGASFEAFQEIIAHLRAPDGCPWDRQQTHQSLRPHLLEEAYELLAALDADDPQAMREELGDLLLQIVLHAQIAGESGEFKMAEVLQGIHTKIVHRHPHVFGNLQVEGVGAVLENWERLKADERQANGMGEKGALESVPIALPSLVLAEQYQQRAARVGFSWEGMQDILQKISEELQEFTSAQSPENQAEELGDLLFTLVSLARHSGVEAESALRNACLRFKRRFSWIEAQARAQGRSIADLSREELAAGWKAAKES